MPATAVHAPTDVLRHEHESIKEALAVLSAMARRLEAGREVPGEDVAALLDFLRTFADACHHAKEEQSLFPAMEAAGLPHRVGPIGVMLHEHEMGRRHIRTMVASSRTLAASPASRREFVDAALAYVVLLSEHIAKENDVLFRMAENMLPAEVMARISGEFARHEAELGSDVHDRMQRVLQKLRGTYAAGEPLPATLHACCSR